MSVHAYSPPLTAMSYYAVDDARSLRRTRTVLTDEPDPATHAGPLATPEGEIAATGRTVRVPFAAVIRVPDGRVDSVHVYLDPLGFMAQLGLEPQPAAA